MGVKGAKGVSERGDDGFPGERGEVGPPGLAVQGNGNKIIMA